MFINHNKSVNINKRRGFTLIEALIAISILVISIAGPITIASKGLSSAMFARDQVTAFYLAQEAIEFIRNKRDENNIKNSNWLAGFETCLNGTSCIIDAKNGKINNCPDDICPVIKYDKNTGFYDYSNNGKDSMFTRKIMLTTIDSKEIKVEVALSWMTGINQKTFIVKEYMFDR